MTSRFNYIHILHDLCLTVTLVVTHVELTILVDIGKHQKQGHCRSGYLPP